MSVVRKERPLSKQEWDRIKFDKEASKIELGGGSQKRYFDLRDNLKNSIEVSNKDRKFKTPRLGVEGCCGRGCNGCLIFWQDPAYEKARQLMADKKQGEMLGQNSRGKMNEVEETITKTA